MINTYKLVLYLIMLNIIMGFSQSLINKDITELEDTDILNDVTNLTSEFTGMGNRIENYSQDTSYSQEDTNYDKSMFNPLTLGLEIGKAFFKGFVPIYFAVDRTTLNVTEIGLLTIFQFFQVSLYIILGIKIYAYFKNKGGD